MVASDLFWTVFYISWRCGDACGEFVWRSAAASDQFLSMGVRMESETAARIAVFLPGWAGQASGGNADAPTGRHAPQQLNSRVARGGLMLLLKKHW